MPETFRTTTVASVNGVQYQQIYDDEAESIERATPSIPAAKVGALTTRTDSDTGVLTMTAGHGITTGAKLDIFWLDAATGDPKSRRHMTAGTVSTNSVPIDGGSGDNLPALVSGTYAVTAMVPVSVPFTVDGDEVIGLVASISGGSAWGYAVFVDDSAAEIAAATYSIGPQFGAVWSRNQGTTNPLAGVVTSVVKLSHGDSTAARTMTALAVSNP